MIVIVAAGIPIPGKPRSSRCDRRKEEVCVREGRRRKRGNRNQGEKNKMSEMTSEREERERESPAHVSRSISLCLLICSLSFLLLVTLSAFAPSTESRTGHHPLLWTRRDTSETTCTDLCLPVWNVKMCHRAHPFNARTRRGE